MYCYYFTITLVGDVVICPKLKSSKNALCQVWLKLALWLFEKAVLNVNYMDFFIYCLIIFHRKGLLFWAKI